MKALLAIIGVAALLMTSATGASEDLFGTLTGTWKGGGEVRGMTSEQTMVWSRVMGGQFTRLEFDNRMRQGEGSEIRFQAHAYYRVGPGGEIIGHWFDSRGVEFPLRGTQTPSSMTIEWGTPDTELGRTEYQLKEDRLEVTDEVLSTDGEWRVFGRSKLQREPSM